MRNSDRPPTQKPDNRTIISFSALAFLILTFNFQASAQDTIQSTITAGTGINSSGKIKSLIMTDFTFGGNGLLFTRVNSQKTLMTGGRGSATFNNRFTIGGGGWGMTKGVEVSGEGEGVYSFAKMGYGGVDFGYLIFPGEKIILGTRLLVAGGAVFKETVPESKDKDFKVFPVLEPDLYCQVSLSKTFRFEIGASYRYIRGTNLQFITDRDLSGFSFYVGFLVRT